MSLLTLDDLKLHLRIEDDYHDDRLEQILDDASGIVLDYLKVEDSQWQTTSGEPDSVPYAVRAATKLVAGALFENLEGNEGGPDPLSETVKSLLHRFRDPAIA
jgi:hypothetical protein